MQGYTHTCTYTHMHTHMHVHTHAHTQTHTHRHTHTDTHTYTHIHTHTNRLAFPQWHIATQLTGDAKWIWTAQVASSSIVYSICKALVLDPFLKTFQLHINHVAGKVRSRLIEQLLLSLRPRYHGNDLEDRWRAIVGKLHSENWCEPRGGVTCDRDVWGTRKNWGGRRWVFSSGNRPQETTQHDFVAWNVFMWFDTACIAIATDANQRHQKTWLNELSWVLVRSKQQQNKTWLVNSHECSSEVNNNKTRHDL